MPPPPVRGDHLVIQLLPQAVPAGALAARLAFDAPYSTVKKSMSFASRSAVVQNKIRARCGSRLKLSQPIARRLYNKRLNRANRLRTSQPSDRAATSRTSGSRKAPASAGTARVSPSYPSVSVAAVRANGVADESSSRAGAGTETAADGPNAPRALLAGGLARSDLRVPHMPTACLW